MRRYQQYRYLSISYIIVSTKIWQELGIISEPFFPPLICKELWKKTLYTETLEETDLHISLYLDINFFPLPNFLPPEEEEEEGGRDN